MKKVILTLSAAALVATYAGSASAQCDFNAIAKGKGMKTSLIRVFAGCPSTEHPSINSATGGGTPSCSPVTVKGLNGEATAYTFDAQKGGCDAKTKSKIEKECADLENLQGDTLGLPAGPCHVTEVEAKCKGILQDDGTTPINANDDSGWSLATLTRSTFNDATNGDMTVIDFPVTFSFEPPNNGGIKFKSSSAIALSEILTDPSGAALPTCTTLETLKVLVKDPDGLPFATMGGSTRGKEE